MSEKTGLQIQSLIDKLGAEQWEERKKASAHLSNLAINYKDKIVPLLLSALKTSIDESNEDKKFWLLRIIGEIDSPQTSAFLVKMLKNPDQSTRLSTLISLSKTKSAAVIPHIIECLKDISWDVSSQAAKTLEAIGSPTVAPLVEKLSSCSDQESYFIINILGSIDIRLLMKFVKHKNKYVRLLITEALGELDNIKAIPLLLEFLSDDRWEVRENAVDALVKHGEKVLVPLIVFLKEKPADVYYWIEKVIENLKIRKITPLIQLLKHQDRDVRSTIAKILGKTRSPQAVDALIESLGDECWFVCKAAASALIEFKDGIPSRMVSILDEKNVDSRKYYWAIYILVKLKEVNLLIERIRNGDVGQVKLVLQECWQLDNPELIDSLVQCLSHQEWIIRSIAAQALNKIGPKVNSILIRHTTSKDEDLKTWVKKILSRTAKDEISQIVDILQNSQDPQLRCSAAGALGSIKNSDSAEPLIQALHNDSDYWVRQYAAEALGEIGREDTILPMLEGLTCPDPNVGLKIVSSLQKFAKPYKDVIVESYTGILSDKKTADKELKFLYSLLMASFGMEEHFSGLIRMLEDETSPAFPVALKTCQQIGVELIPLALDFLKDKNLHLRNNILQFFAFFDHSAKGIIEDHTANVKDTDHKYWIGKAIRALKKEE